MKKMYKKAQRIFCALALVLVAAFAVAGFGGTVFAGSDFDSAETVKDGDKCDYVNEMETFSYYKVELAEKSFLQFTNYNSIRTETGDKIQVVIYDGNRQEVQKLSYESAVTGAYNAFTLTSKELEKGTYYFAVAPAEKDIGNSKKVELTVNLAYTNIKPEAAEKVALPTEGTVERSFIQSQVDKQYVKHYFLLTVADKAYYDFRDSTGTYKLYEGAKEDSAKEYNGTDAPQHSEVVLAKGEYLFSVYSVGKGDEVKVKIKCRDFIDIKSISGPESLEAYLGSKTPFSITLTPAQNESSVNWTSSDENVEFTRYDYDAKETSEDKTKTYIYPRKMGEFTGTVTTGEGVSKTFKVMVKPNPAEAEEMTAYSTSKKKATLELKWKGDTGSYVIYQKNGSSFTKVAETSNKSYTFKNLAPGKTYVFKIDSIYKEGGKAVCNSMSSEITAITAPFTKPTIKSAKQNGKTTYTKAYYEWYWNNQKYVKRWLGNNSSASIKLKFKKAKGVAYYQYATGNSKAGNYLSGSVANLGYKGKIKAKTEKLKLRGVWKKGVCTAYGPWSAVKKVKIKAAK